MRKLALFGLLVTSVVFADSPPASTQPATQPAHADLPPAIKRATSNYEIALAKAGRDYEKSVKLAESNRQKTVDAATAAYLTMIDRELTVENAKKNNDLAVLALLVEKQRVIQAAHPATQPAKSVAATAATTEPSKAIDLLQGVDITRDVIRGTWTLADGKLTVGNDGPAPASLQFHDPLPAGNYRLDVEFARPDGGDAFGVYLPVGSASVVVIVKPHEIGLDTIDGQRFDTNETANGGNYGAKTPTKLIAEVTSDGTDTHIRINFGGKALIDWTGPSTRLAVNNDWKVPDLHTIAVGSWNTSIVIHSMHLQPL